MITRARLAVNDPDEFLNENAFFNVPVGLNPANISAGYKPESKPTPRTMEAKKNRVFVFFSNSKDGFHLSTLAKKMHRNDGPGFTGYSIFEAGGIQIKGIGIHLHQLI